MSVEGICQLSGSCSGLVLVFLGENLSLFGCFSPKGAMSMRKLCFRMPPIILGGHEESRGETLLKTWAGQCVLMNIDFRNVWHIG